VSTPATALGHAGKAIAIAGRLLDAGFAGNRSPRHERPLAELAAIRLEGFRSLRLLQLEERSGS
jgi:hypothetical protein